MKKPNINILGLFWSIKNFDWSKRILFLLLTIVSLLLIFFPILRITTSWDDGMSVRLISGSFFGLAILTLLLLLVLRWRNFHHGIRQFIHVVFGFKDNDHLLNFWLALTIVSSLLWVGNAIGVTSVVTSSISTTVWYNIALILLFVFLFYSLYLMLQEARLLNKTRFMNIIKRDDSDSEEKQSVQSLFEDDD